MKLLFALSFLFSHLCSCGQNDTLIPKTVLKLSPQHFFVNTLKVGVERINKLYNRSNSLFFAGRTDSFNQPSTATGINGLMAEFQFRNYIRPLRAYASKKNHYIQGLYFSGFVQAGKYVSTRAFIFPHPIYQPQYLFDVGWYKEDIHNISSGFDLGIQRVFWNTLFIDVYIGGGFQYAKVARSGTQPPQGYSDYYAIGEPGYNGVIPRLGLLIGIGL